MRVSIDTPFYYFTSVAHDRLPIFQTDKLKEIAADALDEARRSGGFMIFAYVLTPDHYHIITDCHREPSAEWNFGEANPRPPPVERSHLSRKTEDV